MTPQELRNSIFRSALQGKLTKQNAFEMVDLSLINAQKNVRIENSEFEIPDNWYLSTLESFCEIIPTKPYQILEKQVKPFGKYPVISQSKEYQIGFTDDKEKLYKIDTPIIAFGDHTTVVKYIDFDFVIGADGVKLFKPNDLVYFKYLFYALQLLTYGLEKVGGYSRHYKFIKNRPIPVPPFAEQKRIVEKIEELLPYIDQYEQAWSCLDEFNRRFPADMQKSILQMAIQGKLTEQRPEEGTGEELYQQIQKEKRQLIKEGKLKKEKPLLEITNDDMPFVIPENWKWIKLGNIASVLGGKRIPAGRKLTSENTGYKYIRVSDMKNGSVLTDGLLYVPQDIYPSISRYIIHKEDIYITVAGTIGKVGKIPAEIDGANLTENADRLVFSTVYQDWLIKCLETPFIQSQIAGVTTKVGQPKLAIKRIQELILPLPPLLEQKRIVARLEELLPLCEKLK